MKTRDRKILEHDDALVKRERSIRFSRTAATGLAALMFFGIIMFSVQATRVQPPCAETKSAFIVSTDNGNIDLKIPVFLMCACFFWAAIAHEYNLRSKHIDSIKLYRGKLKEREAVEIQNEPGRRG